MNYNDITSYIIIYLPLLRGFITDYNFLRRMKGVRTTKGARLTGYTYSIFLPAFFTLVAFQTFDIIKDLIKNKNLHIFITAIIVGLSYLISNKFFNYRVKKLKIKRGTETWIMNRFYSDLLYAICLALPALITYLFFLAA